MAPPKRDRTPVKPKWNPTGEGGEAWAGPVAVTSKEGLTCELRPTGGRELPAAMVELLEQVYERGTPVRATFWDGTVFSGVVRSLGSKSFCLEGSTDGTFWAPRRALAVLEFSSQG